MVPLPPILHGRVLRQPQTVLRVRLNRGVWEVLVQWLGRPASDATWEQLESFTSTYPSVQLVDELFVGEGGIILVEDNLARRNWEGSLACVFCHKEETINHLFFDLPKSKNHDTISVVIDNSLINSPTKYFIPLSHPYTALTVAQAFLSNVYKLHGLPQVIVSDRDKVFTRHLCLNISCSSPSHASPCPQPAAVTTALPAHPSSPEEQLPFTAAEFASYCADEGIQHHYSTPYSPQQNGVVERCNQTLWGWLGPSLSREGCRLSFGERR
ncbi:hypothetical protein U9M48_043263 [Paspalum notatum var. saurae]|uniref:Integrase catalytic domain-containing protein n=1 Tax=Paspalum notatum var. saurae TaxID=547442 RepID=A0AAQ3UYX2_PASNO